MGKEEQRCLATGHGIICAALPRSGTASLAAALTTLGLGPVHHGLNVTNTREYYAWGQAAWCSMPYFRAAGLDPARRLPFYINPADALLPWTRGDWDRLIGGYRVVTDVASFYTKQLIQAYPEAKVILVERPVDGWRASFGEVVVDRLCCGVRGFVLGTLGPLAGFPALYIVRDIILGWLGTETRTETWARMEVVHAEYYAMVRREVPREQVLEFQHGDGWAPLCEFLGVAAPDEPFPRVNERAEILEVLDGLLRQVVVRVIVRLALAVVCLGLFSTVAVFFWHRTWGDVQWRLALDWV
ncbi:uncharacterized protein MAM_04338 [Metarhizium album ARSEF 1941]|uniref:Efflux pump antibiotic resistance protein n=1 Tax=Metarhizium album (strain ARSEF 1941) TaxID=1081103 RepID=A0A0B2WWG0_METAS|nr:uncharacterized protein MAM_04338 [Metarhizium album ARSEF 1941]KHN97949.1 hypothetical protein MAM_04338 [Metarhizium album ARSEF 1941]